MSICKSPRKLSVKNIYWLAVFLSFIFSLWISFTGGIVNMDGILYLRVADLLVKGDFVGAAKLYEWFFYPLLIAGVSKFSGLGLEMSAHLLTALFSAILTYAFLACVRILGGDRKILLWAAFIIVFHPVFMDIRSKVFRDHGYLAFYLLSIFCFLKFYRFPSWRYAFFWGLSMLLATLFRIEGLLFLFMLPISIMFNKSWKLSVRFRHFCQAHLVNMGLFAVAVIVLLLNPGMHLLEMGRLGDPLLLVGKFYGMLSGGLHAKIDLLQNMILPSHSDKYALPMLLFIPFVILLHKLFAALTPLMSLVLVWRPSLHAGRMKKFFLPVFVWLVSLNIVMLLVFLFVNFYLQKRFVFPLVLILMLLLPFIFNDYMERWNALSEPSWKQRVLYCLIVVALLLNCLDCLVTFPGRSKFYIKDAGLWLKDNISSQATLYANNAKIYYYSGHLTGDRENYRQREKLTAQIIEKKPWQNCDYIALWVTRKSIWKADELSAIVGLKPIKIFANERQDKVLIYAGKPAS